MYINETVLVRNGGRKTTDPSIKSLKKALYATYKKCVGEDEIVTEDAFFEAFERNQWQEHDGDVWDGIQTLLYEHPKLSKDIGKVDFSFENLFCFASEGQDYGFDQFGDLAVLKCIAGGDWQFPVFFIVYYVKYCKVSGTGGTRSRESYIKFPKELVVAIIESFTKVPNGVASAISIINTIRTIVTQPY